MRLCVPMLASVPPFFIDFSHRIAVAVLVSAIFFIFPDARRCGRAFLIGFSCIRPLLLFVPAAVAIPVIAMPHRIPHRVRAVCDHCGRPAASYCHWP
jgi:hypothetical protein